ncbi:MAG: hypothetical protein LAT61_04725 [Alcanivorax sp.]|nr:hypothetical protein [Alcanivorax sp.]
MFSAIKKMSVRLRLPCFCFALLSPVFGYAFVSDISPSPGLKPLNDEEMSSVVGQALIVSNKIQGNGGSNGTAGLTFYSAGIDAELRMNLNIDLLELGRTGGTPGMADGHVDILAEHVMFGCTADASNNCVDSSIATQLRDFIFDRPFFQFAIENDDQPAFRRVVGLRLGAEHAEGPLSIGEFKVFSGYLNATANFTMEEQGRGSNPQDVAVTCGLSTAPCVGNHNHNTGVNAFGLDGVRSLGLNNDQACFLGICAAFRTLTVSFGTVQRQNRPVVAAGSRLTQASVFNANLNSAVDQMVGSLRVERSDGILSSGLINALLPIISGQASNSIKGQLYNAFGLNATHGNWNNTAAQRNALENHVIPYNINNLHRVEVDSPLFGLSFQEREVRYPGYVQAVPAGWGMYLPDAFTLDVSHPAAIFVQNIVSGQAAAGNIIALDPVFDNCWGAATFC